MLSDYSRRKFLSLLGKTLGLVIFSNSAVLSSTKNEFAQTRDTLPDLIIGPNERKTLSNRFYRYNNIHIHSGGTLDIQRASDRWCIFWVTGKVTIAGRINARKYVTGARTVEDNTPDGKKISHTYLNLAEGGTGGNGGQSRLYDKTRAGGIGAVGTNKYGGGGGSGGGLTFMGSATRIGGPGNNATDWRGAPLASGGKDNLGGNGGQINPIGNGGLLLIYCAEFDGSGGVIDIRGENGGPGQNGGNGYLNPLHGGRGSGGGGGGAPGCDGGHFAAVAKSYVKQCDVLTQGGSGGHGGRAGLHYLNGATPGTSGNPGSAGIVDWYSLEDWNSQ